MNNSEIKMGESPCLEFEGKQTIKIKDDDVPKDAEALRGSPLSFTFDGVFNQSSTQIQVFNEIGISLVESVLEGFNSTLFVYGQTSSGKTHTMQGPDIRDEDGKGVIPRSIQHLFKSIENSLVTTEWLVKVSVFEIYMEKIRDLLDVDRRDLRIREDKFKGVYIQNISEFFVSTLEEIMDLLATANKNRIVACTKMNEASSRSHLLFEINVYQKNTDNGAVVLLLI
jgi:kinesin family protein 5